MIEEFKLHPSDVQPDVELAAAITGQFKIGDDHIKVYSDWERPTNGLPDDFFTVYINGDVAGLSMDTPYAEGYLMVSLYCKMNDDGSVKKNRIKKILSQFDNKIDGLTTENYHFEYAVPQFITPTTPNMSSGYSITTLNLRWKTTSNFGKNLNS